MGELGAAPVRVTASPVPLSRFDWVDLPELSVIIVTFGTGLALERCIAALSGALDADQILGEVIVVDNAHPGRGHAAGNRLAISTSGVRLIEPDSNLGFGGGNDAGVAVARAEWIMLLNPDTIVEPGQLRTLVTEAKARPNFIVAPALANPDGTVQEIGMRIISNGDTRPVLEHGSAQPDYASAACWVLARDTYRRLDGFDDRYFPAYYEDADMALRLAESGGGTHVLETVCVTHEHGSRSTDPDVTRQRQLFMERWPDLVASRPAD